MKFDAVMEGKAISLAGKSASGVIEGYASLFGKVDDGGDVVMPGAFAKSLAALKAEGRSVKMLWQHDPSQPIGIWDDVREDKKGLWVKGRILADVEKGREAIALYDAGAIDGLSIGYRTIAATRGSKGERQLHEIDIWEVSLVTFPMLRTARVAAKAAAEEFTSGNVAAMKREVEDYLREAGFSNTEAKGGASALAAKIGAMREAGPDFEKLAALLRDRAKL